MSNFRTIDRETGFLLPPSVDEWLPEKHLARFVVEVVEGLDLRAMSGSYRGCGSASQAKAEASGKKPRGKPPEPPVEGPRPNDQINLTDEDSRIMRVAGGGFDQCYNAQAAVAAGSLLVVAIAVSQAPNDKQQLEPMVDKIGALPEELGKPECLLADTGYFSAANVAVCEKAGIEPLIAIGRQPHHPPLAERFAAAPEAPD